MRRLPERVVIARFYGADAMPGDLADQRLGQRLVVRERYGALGGPMRRKLLAKRLEARRHRREAQVRLVRRECEEESRLDEEWRSPLDRFGRLRRNALEDLVEPAQMRLAGFR